MNSQCEEINDNLRKKMISVVRNVEKAREHERARTYLFLVQINLIAIRQCNNF